MLNLATLPLCLLMAAVFAAWVPLARLFDAFQPMIVALSIMAAAVFVRLNRGMPTLDWKSLEFEKRRRLTGQIVDLTREYLVIISFDAVLLITLVGLSAVGRDTILGSTGLFWLSPTPGWPDWAHRATAGLVGGLATLCIARMAYVAWRDYDIVRVQKTLIDASGAQEEADQQTKLAGEKVARIRGAGLRAIPIEEPRAWDG